MKTPSRNPKVSVRQCVSGTPRDKNAKPGEGSSRPRRRVKQKGVTLWPEDIPQGVRIPLSGGHRSFVAGYQVLQSEMMKGRTIDLQGHCLVYCHGSRLLIERDPYWRIVEPGDGVLLSDTTLKLSELPVEDGTSGGFIFYFFGDEELASIVPMHPRAHALMFRSAEFPCTEGIMPIQKLPLERVFNPEVGAKGLLHPLLTVVFNTIYLPLWKLSLRRVVIPRIRIQIFLENLVLRPLDQHDAVMAQYPGGKNALLREMGRLKMGSVAAIVDQRRFELCFAWSNYGQKSFEEIAAALCVSQPGRFKSRYDRWFVEQNLVVFDSVGAENYSDTLLAAHPPFLPSVHGQYWNRREAEESMARHRKRMEDDEDYRVQQEMAAAAAAHHPDLVNRVFPGYVDPYAPTTLPGEIDPAFFEMKSTGLAMVMAAEGLTSIPGLEDCADLLLAA